MSTRQPIPTALFDDLTEGDTIRAEILCNDSFIVGIFAGFSREQWNIGGVGSGVVRYRMIIHGPAGTIYPRTRDVGKVQILERVKTTTSDSYANPID